MTTKPDTHKVIFKTTLPNENYRYGDLNKSPNVKYEVCGIIKEYITDQDNELIGIVISGNRIFRSNIKDVKVVPFEDYDDYVKKLATRVKSSLFKRETLHCSCCGNKVNKDSKVCSECDAEFI